MAGRRETELGMCSRGKEETAWEKEDGGTRGGLSLRLIFLAEERCLCFSKRGSAPGLHRRLQKKKIKMGGASLFFCRGEGRRLMEPNMKTSGGGCCERKRFFRVRFSVFFFFKSAKINLLIK